MKHIRTLFIIIIVLAFTPIHSYAQSYESPVEYMQKISDALDNTKRDTWKYLKAVTRGKRARKIERKRENLIDEIYASQNQIRKMPKYETRDSLRIAAIDYLDMSYTVLKEDYDKILDMEDIAEQSYDMMEAYLLAKEKASEKLNQSFEDLVYAQEKFAEKHDVTLQEGEQDRMSRKISDAGETLSYYNDVYLIFFKAYKEEAYVMEALDKNDIMSFEQSTASLKQFSEEGIEDLKKMDSFQGDASLKNGAIKILRFYIKEAEGDFATMTDYFIKKDNFEKIKKSFDAKKKRNRTKQDIKQFNKAVKEYNAAAKKANKILNSGNKRRQRYLDAWNETVEAFFDRHA